MASFDYYVLVFVRLLYAKKRKITLLGRIAIFILSREEHLSCRYGHPSSPLWSAVIRDFTLATREIRKRL
jgi:hypothetical protein